MNSSMKLIKSATILTFLFSSSALNTNFLCSLNITVKKTKITEL